jgi:hypothetical protein
MIDAGTNTAVGWFPVLTLFLGFAASWISEWFRDGRTIKREREAREAASRVQRSERRTNFQRETLLNLQDSVAKLARATGRMHHLDEMEHRKTGKWRSSRFPENLNADAHQSNVSVMLLTSRVRDDDIRELAETFRRAANEVPICPNAEAAGNSLAKMAEALGSLHQSIGKMLRKLDDDEDASEITTT